MKAIKEVHIMTQSERCFISLYFRRGLVSGLFFGLLVVILIAGSIGLLGCESGDSHSSGSSETGDIVIGLTDDEGDFVRYSVDVLSLTHSGYGHRCGHRNRKHY